MGEGKTRDRVAYQRERRKQSVELYFESPQALAEYQEMAKKAGYSTFNKFLLQLVHNATSGNVYQPEYVDGLKASNEKLEKRLDSARDENEEYRAQVRDLNQQRDALLTALHSLPLGAEVAGRFLEDRTGKVV